MKLHPIIMFLLLLTPIPPLTSESSPLFVLKWYQASVEHKDCNAELFYRIVKASMGLLNSSKGVTAWKKDKYPDFSILKSILKAAFASILYTAKLPQGLICMLGCSKIGSHNTDYFPWDCHSSLNQPFKI